MSTSPSTAGSSPASTRNSVDLPTPLAPTSPTCRPGAILNETSENSRSPPGWAYARLETTTWDTIASLGHPSGADGVRRVFEPVTLEQPGEVSGDLLDHVRAAVDERGVELDDGGAQPQ